MVFSPLKNRNVLIFPAGTEIGLEIYQALKSCKEVILHGASQNVSNHAEYLFEVIPPYLTALRSRVS